MERIVQGRQEGMKSRKAAQTRDLDIKVQFSLKHTQIDMKHSSLPCSTCATQLGGWCGPDLDWRLFLPFPSRDILVCHCQESLVCQGELAATGGASGRPRQHADFPTVTGASEDLPSHNICLCTWLCIERGGGCRLHLSP